MSNRKTPQQHNVRNTITNHSHTKLSKMYKTNKPNQTTIQVNDSYLGERIEEKITRILNNNEPITDTAPLIYQERKDGVQPEYNIKTDRMEHALDAVSALQKSYTAKREERHKPKDPKPTEPGQAGEIKPQ